MYDWCVWGLTSGTWTREQTRRKTLYFPPDRTRHQSSPCWRWEKKKKEITSSQAWLQVFPLKSSCVLLSSLRDQISLLIINKEKHKKEGKIRESTVDASSADAGMIIHCGSVVPKQCSRWKNNDQTEYAEKLRIGRSRSRVGEDMARYVVHRPWGKKKEGGRSNTDGRRWHWWKTCKQGDRVRLWVE